jgi:class 3 adenylate cyclase
MATCPSCGAAVAPDARFCARCGASVGAPAAEERKLATILFADVIGSTDLGEQLDPERLRSLLQEYFGAMSRVVEEWGGTVEKYIGDAMLAVFGVPSARERLGAELFAERVRATLPGQPGASGSMPAAASGIVGD